MQVSIPITQAACLFGRVMIYGYKSNTGKTAQNGKFNGAINQPHLITDGSSNGKDAELSEEQGLADAIVELKNSSEIKRTVTDKQGQFRFTELRPGQWILKIYSDNLPQYHYLEKDTFQIDLKPGQETEISAKVLPKKRRIRIITEGQTLLEEKQE